MMKSVALLTIGALILFSAGTTQAAVDRNVSTNKFNWGDDLSGISSVPAGAAGGNYETRASVQLKSNHLPDIKSAIDLSVTACGITSDVWSQVDAASVGEIGYPGIPIRAAQINNLRRAIEDLYLEKGQPPPPSLQGDVSPGESILRSHIQDMRTALDDLAVLCAVPAAAVCGNGIQEAGEQCEDGNVINGDGCSATCQTETPKVWTGGGFTRRTMGYTRTEACELAGSAWTSMQYFCGAGDAAGQSCDGSRPRCVYGPGVYSGVIPAAPYGPGIMARMSASGSCESLRGIAPCACWFPTLTCE